MMLQSIGVADVQICTFHFMTSGRILRREYNARISRRRKRNEKTVIKDQGRNRQIAGSTETGRDTRSRAHRPHRAEGRAWRNRD
ncbi:hypothetical protein AGR7A_pTi0091 [Agrobacterium deltaense NCPPB 1641]|uniref:Uncharacterized protein n=1 Tax=Agrobacterium deltaense NCPPB 1641 TaxID=1183425 RepID=A0A1S7UC31_9HYPH|nr:hypothetical protein AGR7A_pTi0091 [Agrobacterium deltaense NCPPB 1641]